MGDQANSVWHLLRSVQGGERDYQRLLVSIQNLFEADGCSLFLKREPEQVFVLQAQTGTSKNIPEGAVILPGEGIAGAAIVDQVAMIIGDPNELLNLKKRSAKRRDEIGSSIVVPLISPSNGVFGVLCLSRKQSSNHFDDRSLNVATTLASNLALILSNALLVRKLSQSHATLSQVLHSAGIEACIFDANGRSKTHTAPLGKWVLGNTDTWSDLISSLPVELSRSAIECHRRAKNSGDTSSKLVEIEGRTLRTTVIRLTDGGVAWVLQDQTEHFNMVREANRLQRLAEIGQMTAAVAHDIRNPLTSMLGAVTLIEECPERTAELTAIIKEEIGNLSELCTEFLKYAKPLELRLKLENISEILVKVALLESFASRESEIDIVVEPELKPMKICIDRDRIENVLKNLVRNAVQASGAGSKVTLKAIENGFSVSDEGSGISDESYVLLFMPFQTTKARGTGLGLCNVKKIIDAHGGHIDVERLKKGTRFTILFPNLKNSPCEPEN